ALTCGDGGADGAVGQDAGGGAEALRDLFGREPGTGSERSCPHSRIQRVFACIVNGHGFPSLSGSCSHLGGNRWGSNKKAPAPGGRKGAPGNEGRGRQTTAQAIRFWSVADQASDSWIIG